MYMAMRIRLIPFIYLYTYGFIETLQKHKQSNKSPRGSRRTVGGVESERPEVGQHLGARNGYCRDPGKNKREFIKKNHLNGCTTFYQLFRIMGS